VNLRGQINLAKFVILPASMAAAGILDYIGGRLGSARAIRWMLSACDDLDGMSPIQAIKAGRYDDAEWAAIVETEKKSTTGLSDEGAREDR